MTLRPLLLFAMLFAWGCSPKTSSPASTSQGDIVDTAPTGEMIWASYDEVTELTVGQSLGVRKTPTAFTFSKVISDSRCPKGADCIRAGEAVLLINLPEGGSLRVDVPASGRVPGRFSVPGGNVTVMKLSPYPSDQGKINPDNYVLTVKIGKASVD